MLKETPGLTSPPCLSVERREPLEEGGDLELLLLLLLLLPPMQDGRRDSSGSSAAPADRLMKVGDGEVRSRLSARGLAADAGLPDGRTTASRSRDSTMTSLRTPPLTRASLYSLTLRAFITQTTDCENNDTCKITFGLQVVAHDRDDRALYCLANQPNAVTFLRV